MQQQTAFLCLSVLSYASSYNSSANIQPCSNSISNWKGATPGSILEVGVKKGLQGEKKEQNR